MKGQTKRLICIVVVNIMLGVLCTVEVIGAHHRNHTANLKQYLNIGLPQGRQVTDGFFHKSQEDKMDIFAVYLKIVFLGLFLGLAAILVTGAVKMQLVLYRILSLIEYCELGLFYVIRAGPEGASRMIYEKLNEKSILLGYRNEQLKQQMRTVGINEEADDYGYEKRTFKFCIKDFPEAKSQEIIRIEFIDFKFADLRKKMEKIRQAFIVKEQLKKELIRHFKMVVRFDKI